MEGGSNFNSTHSGSLSLLPFHRRLWQEIVPCCQWSVKGVNVSSHDNPDVIRGSQGITEGGYIVNHFIRRGGVFELGDQGGQEPKLCHHTA